MYNTFLFNKFNLNFQTHAGAHTHTDVCLSIYSFVSLCKNRRVIIICFVVLIRWLHTGMLLLIPLDRQTCLTSFAKTIQPNKQAVNHITLVVIRYNSISSENKRKSTVMCNPV